MRSGLVTAVYSRPHGSTVSADTPAGATILTVEDADDFSELGGVLQLPDGSRASYTAADIDTGAVTLLAALAAPLTTGDVVLTVPLGTSWEADVQTLEGDSITADVPHALVPLLSEGIAPTDQLQAVLLDQVEVGEWVVADVVDERPALDYSYIDPGTVPAPPPPTDGLPPSTSPTPVVQGAIGALAVTWSGVANADPVVYEVHGQVSATQPGGLGAAAAALELEALDHPSLELLREQTGRAVDATYLGEVAGTSYWIRRTPAGLPLLPGTNYDVWLIARDRDGAAAPSAVVVGTPAQAQGPDIAADAILADHILAGQVTAEKLAASIILAGTIIAGDPASQHVQLDGQVGLQLISANGNPLITLPVASGQSAMFRGTVQALSIDILQGLILRGVNNIMGSGSTLTLMGKLTAPLTAPTVKVDWERQQLYPDSTVYRALAWDPGGDGGRGSWWIGEDTVDSGGTGSWLVREYRVSDLSVLRTLEGGNPRWGSVRSIVRQGAHVYVLTAFVKSWGVHKYLASTLARVRDYVVTADLTANSDGNAGAAMLGKSEDGSTLLLGDVAAFSGGNNWLWTPRVRPMTLPDSGAVTYGAAVTLAGRTFSIFDQQPHLVAAEGRYWMVAAADPTYGSNAWAWTTAGVAVSDQDFPFPGNPNGLVHDGVQFWSLVGSQLVRHTPWNWTTESNRYWVGTTWWEDVH